MVQFLLILNKNILMPVMVQFLLILNKNILMQSHYCTNSPDFVSLLEQRCWNSMRNKFVCLNFGYNPLYVHSMLGNFLSQICIRWRHLSRRCRKRRNIQQKSKFRQFVFYSEPLISHDCVAFLYIAMF